MLACTGIYTLRYGSADAIVSAASVEMNGWIASGGAAEAQRWARVHDDLLLASRLAPSSPDARELLGVLDAQRRGSPKYLAESLVALKQALKLRPTSPYTWASIVEVMYLQGDIGKAFEQALVTAITLGPWEPEVQRAVANYGLAVWDEVAPATRDAVATAVANGMRRTPKEMLQIARRRGRLAIACRRLSVEPRTPDPQSIQLCQGTEATQ
jgi:hypothetical protein